MSLLNFDITNVNYAMLGIFAVLSFASLIVFILTKKNPQKNYRELVLRMQSWWFIIIFFSLMVFAQIKIAIFCIAFISFLAFKEYLSLIPIRKSDHRVLFWAYLSIPIQFYIISTGWYQLFIIFIPVYVFLFLPFRTVLIGDTNDFLANIGRIQWGLMTTVFSMGHLAYLLMLDPGKNLAGGRSGLLIYVVFLTQFNDVAQYCWGKSFGKHKIIPKVSPNKTWEGFLGGVATTSALSVLIAPYLTPITFPASIFIGVLLGISGFVGDVNISALKRDLGIKDSGTMLPGHGGILDRIDSLSYTAPIFFHFIDYYFYK
jgi:phosphatidate cytidylyltransferase